MDLGIPIESLVSDCLVNGNWTLSHLRSERQVQLHIYISTINLSLGNEKIIWRGDGLPREKFISKDLELYKAEETTMFMGVFGVAPSNGS